MLWSAHALANDAKGVSQKLLVGAQVAPPFAMKTADGRWEGLSIELWQALAQDLGVNYECIEFNDHGQVMELVQNQNHYNL
jgi:ABC-type amino acid transport substrate-binding protein